MCVIMPNFIKIGQTVAKIWRFNGGENGGRPPSWIFDIRIFSGRSGVPNFVKIGQTVAEISLPPSWILKNSKF